MVGSLMFLSGIFGSGAVLANSRDAGTIIVDGRTFSSARNSKGDTWKYDAKTHTLTLKDYDGMYIDLSTQENAVIELTGTNKVASHVEAPAIQVEGPLTIQGDGSLELEVTACRSALYAKNGDLYICGNEVLVKSSGTASDSAYLLMADGDGSVGLDLPVPVILKAVIGGVGGE